MAAKDYLVEMIVSALGQSDLKPNKLRKVVMESANVKAKCPEATWKDFAVALEEAEKSGSVSRQTQADFSEVCVLKKKGSGSSKKRPLETNTSVSGSAEAQKKGKREGKSEPGPIDQQKAVIKRVIEVPSAFVPFLLRLSGQKVRNIETNTKTHIHCSPSTSSEDSTGASEARKITITGGEEKHLSAAQILIDNMLKAFEGNGRKSSGKPQGKPPGKGPAGAKGGQPAATEEARKKKNDRKFY